MKIDGFKCKCGNDNFFMNSHGVFCDSCGSKVLRVLYVNPDSPSYEQVLSKASKLCSSVSCNKCKLRSVCLDYDLRPADIIDFIEQIKEIM